MTLPSKFYDTLKFLITFIPYIVTIVSGLLLGLGVTDQTTTIITLCIGAVGSICDAIIKTCSANHWKSKAEDGTVTEVIDDAQ